MDRVERATKVIWMTAVICCFKQYIGYVTPKFLILNVNNYVHRIKVTGRRYILSIFWTKNVHAYGETLMFCAGLSERAVIRKSTCRALFSKMLFLVQNEQMLTPTNAIFNLNELRNVRFSRTSVSVFADASVRSPRKSSVFYYTITCFQDKSILKR